MRKTVDTDNETKTMDNKETPGSENKKSYCKRNTVTSERSHYSPWLSILKKAILLQCIVYISLPVLLGLFPWILGHVIFSHWLRFPYLVDLTSPAELSLNHTLNFYLSPEEGISLGAWHTVPDSQWEKAQGAGPEWYSETLGDGSPVIIYLHGNVGSRAINHRVELVKILSAAGYHVLSLDYRGYGDSSGEPSEVGMTSDALYLYQWVKTRSRTSQVCLWGHSLGTGVATNAAVKIQEQAMELARERARDLGDVTQADLEPSYAVDGVILEAPYTNMEEEVARHPLSMMYQCLPGFESVLHHVMQSNNMVFANDENLKTLTTRVLFLHAEDDNVVPFDMGQKLYQIALQAPRQRYAEDQVRMVSYSESLGYSHNYIYLDPNLASVVGRFLQSKNNNIDRPIVR
ncbi:lysophosphatidylserine lipase ABHD12-like [Salvelinus fontinalis]|uniref:lysophosphatidylserine lipase ABHD12-like n=1 Tax=Salvelinus fontinalis TaxID=8038 RepID=UPI002485EA76|nr:lysophosphatidylserine lipase ABHD12-like [Salvelinus fontinalis]XP_055718508.1 lysophosphatidylserine lipase ABHD12-like [Salvelinus fontinalis]